MAQSIQTTFSQDPAIGVEGQRTNVRASDEISSRVNTSRKLVSVALTAVNTTHYIVTINGTAFDYTSDGSATTGEIALGLKALINAGSEPVLASGTDTPLILESTRDSEFNADFSDTSAATRRLTGDFSHTYNGNMVATVLVAQGQEMPAGLGVCMDERSTDDQAIRLPRQATDVTSARFLGVLLNDLAKVAYASTYAKQTFHRNTMVPVLEHGEVFVRVEQDVSKGDPAYCRFAAGAGGTQLGAFRKDDDTTSAALCAHAVFESAGVAGGLAKLKVSR